MLTRFFVEGLYYIQQNMQSQQGGQKDGAANVPHMAKVTIHLWASFPPWKHKSCTLFSFHETTLSCCCATLDFVCAGSRGRSTRVLTLATVFASVTSKLRCSTSPNSPHAGLTGSLPPPMLGKRAEVCCSSHFG